ncbi:hypothetical protein L2E82_40110 [Cichorium intybus]|uniref:Uncharacterized protein n=1 Tax=Cichorium intybus TaxID=13427 RepID=A0ACB9AJF1_CICIN|nr:hypothetical protein L2E82_40110 [Cichorium intybus]
MISNRFVARLYNLYSNAKIAEYGDFSQTSYSGHTEILVANREFNQRCFMALRVSTPAEDHHDEYLRLPPITANESRHGLIWEQMAILCSNTFVDEWVDAAGVAANHPKCQDHILQNNA